MQRLVFNLRKQRKSYVRVVVAFFDKLNPSFVGVSYSTVKLKHLGDHLVKLFILDILACDLLHSFAPIQIVVDLLLRIINQFKCVIILNVLAVVIT